MIWISSFYARPGVVRTKLLFQVSDNVTFSTCSTKKFLPLVESILSCNFFLMWNFSSLFLSPFSSGFYVQGMSQMFPPLLSYSSSLMFWPTPIWAFSKNVLASSLHGTLSSTAKKKKTEIQAPTGKKGPLAEVTHLVSNRIIDQLNSWRGITHQGAVVIAKR